MAQRLSEQVVEWLTVGGDKYTPQTTVPLWVQGRAIFGTTTAKNTNTNYDSNLLTMNGHMVIEPSYNSLVSYNQGLRINRDSQGRSAIILGGEQGSLMDTGNAVWYVGAQSTPNDATTASSGITNSVFIIRKNGNEAEVNTASLKIDETGVTSGHGLGILNRAAASGAGLSLYGGATAGLPTYGMAFAGTGTYGTHGSISANDWATYFTMSDSTTRGWIFKRGSTNVASIDGSGNAVFDGNATVNKTIYFGTGCSATAGKSVLGFNPTYPDYGMWYFDKAVDVLTLSASGNADSETDADFAINVHGAGTLSTRNKRIPHTGNTTGTVGASNKPVYVNAGTITEIDWAFNAGVDSGTANRVAYYSGATQVKSAANLVTDGNYLSNVTYLSVNNAHQTGYRFYVTGASYFNGAVTSNNVINATKSDTAEAIVRSNNSNGSVELLASTNRGLYDRTKAQWIVYGTQDGTKTYIPRWASKGSTTNPVYFNSSGEPAACTYSLKATVNDGTGTHLAYYSSATSIDSYNSTVGEVRRPIYLNAGVPTVANYTVAHFGNAGKNNMNDVGRLYASVGMTNLTDPSNNHDNPMNGTTKSTSWHLYWDASYGDNPNETNAWVAQIVNKAGTNYWWVRSRGGGTITNGTAWASPWRHLVTSPQAGQGSGTQPIYINENGETVNTSYALNATVQAGTSPYVAYYSGNNTISDAEATTTMIMPAHYYHNMYNNNAAGTEVYVHYYYTGATATNTNANLRVKNGSAYNTFRICGASEVTWDGTQIRATNGYLASTKNGNTVSIGSQNGGFCHITNSADIPFWFNKDIQLEKGKIIGGADTQYRPYQIYMGRNVTNLNELNAATPLIEFSNSDRSQYCQLVYSDYDSVQPPDSLTIVGNQTGTALIMKSGPIWIQGGSNAGGNVNRLNTTSGMPGNMQYNQSRRGTQIYANGIAFADPYNGNGNNDAGWIRQIETTGSSGILEIATGDDGNEPIYIRQYNTSNAIAREFTVLDTSGNTTPFGHIIMTRTAAQGRIIGPHGVYTGTAGARYSNSALEIRENGLVGNTQSLIGYAPTIGWHWSNRIAATTAFHSDGRFYFIKQNGVDRAEIDANIRGYLEGSTFYDDRDQTDARWYKFCVIKMTGNYQDAWIKFDVSSGEDARRCGRLVARFRTNATWTDAANATPELYWEDIGENVDVNDFIFTLDGSGNGQLWCRCPERWTGWHFIVINRGTSRNVARSDRMIDYTEEQRTLYWHLQPSAANNGPANYTNLGRVITSVPNYTLRAYNGYNTKMLLDSGTATYMAYYSAANTIAGASWARMIDGCLNLYPVNNNYREGMRIHPIGSWSDITLQGNTNSGNTAGISTEDWFIGNNNGTFWISRGSSGAGNSYIRSASNKWYVNTTSGNEVLNVGGWVGTVGSNGWYSVTHGGGWYMTDAKWIRNYNYKPLDINIGANNSYGIGGHRTAAVFRGDSHVSIQLTVNSTLGYGLAANSNGNFYFGKFTNGNIESSSGSSYILYANTTFLSPNNASTVNLGLAATPFSNLYLGKTDGSGIYYSGTKATYRMIRFIDNTSDNYGNGISIGGGGQTIIGGGESADTMCTQISNNGAEIMWIGNDGTIDFYPEIQSGYSASNLVRITAGRIWAGVNGDTTREAQVGVQSGAGQIMMWSAAATGGDRGLWLPAHGTGSAFAIIRANTNNFVTILADDVWGAKVRLYDNWVGFYNARQGGTRYGYVQANADRMYFRKENGANNNIGFDFGAGTSGQPSIYCSGEYISGAYNGLRIRNMILRNDNDSVYFLIASNNNTPGDNWNTLRPFYFKLSTGRVTMANSATISTCLGVNGTNDSYNFYVNGSSYFNGNATHNGNISFTNSGTAFRGINYGTMGDNDMWRIGGAATAANAGYLELATADDGNEPIYVRQYTGTFGTVTRTLTLLNGSGYMLLPSYINVPTANNENPTISQIIVTNGSDSYYRKASIAHLASQLSANGTFNANVLKRTAWWANSDTTKTSDNLRGGITFAYTNKHNVPTTGTLVSFDCSTNENYSLQLQGQYSGRELYFRNRNGDNGTWTAWTRILNEANYTVWTVTKTGSGASGTWGINVTGSSGSCTGNAASATKLQTARAINGTNFDGTAAITTAHWGTARTITIGGTGKSVNGSANVSWSKDEILGSSSSSYVLRGDKAWSNAIANHWNPTANGSYDLGATGTRWRALYLTSQIRIGPANTDASSNNQTYIGAGTIELAASTPYIDFKNNTGADYNARIIASTSGVLYFACYIATNKYGTAAPSGNPGQAGSVYFRIVS